ncbi:hypothetical protein FJTKL_12066 [Diaporthe vaccinii]
MHPSMPESVHIQGKTTYTKEGGGIMRMIRDTTADTQTPIKTAAVNQHKKLYGGEDDGSTQHDSSSMGNAAALQALKMFTGGDSNAGSSKSEFIGLAMAEASKLFEQQSAAGKVSSDTSKESAVQQAGEMALKMYLKSKTGGGESGGGGSSGLLSLASKFM